MLRYLIIIPALFFSYLSSQAQITGKLKTAQYGLQYYRGIIIPHHKSINYLTKGYGQMLNLSITLPSFGQKPWHKLYNYPDKGIGYSFTDFGNPTVLGNSHALYAFINLPIIKRKYFIFNFDATVGVAYLNRPFDKKMNNTNIIIGSHSNAYLRVYANTKFLISDKISLKTGFGISHFSNGAIKKPNLGINLISVFTEVAFSPTTKKITEIKPIEKFIKSYDFSVLLSGGWRQSYPPYKKIYAIAGASLKAEYNFSPRHRAGLGLDIFYDEIYGIRTTREIYENKKADTPFFTGIHLSYDLVFGSLSFTAQVGLHPSLPTSGYPILYQRFALKKRFRKHFLAGIGLKSYMGTAQFIEWRTGYYFSKNKTN